MSRSESTASLLRRVMLYGLATGVPGIINFVALALYTRLLAPDAYGRYALVVSVIGLANAIMFQWLRLGTRRYFVRYRESRRPFLATVLAAYLGLAVAATIVGICVLLTRENAAERLMVALGLILVWAQAWVELSLELVLVALRPYRYGVMMLVRSLVAVSIGGVLAAGGFGATGLISGLAVGYVVTGFWLARSEWRGIDVRDRQPEVLRTLVRYGAPLTGTLALEFVVNSSDRFFLSVFSGTAAVGVYSASYDLGMQGLTMLMVAVSMAAFPMAVRTLEQSGIDAARRQVRSQAVVLASIALPSASGLALLAPNISTLFLGEEFRQAARVLLPLVALAALLLGIKALFFDLAFQLGASTTRQLWVSGIAAAVNVGFNLWLIPLHGPVGAAYATIAAYAVATLLSWWMGRSVFALPLPWNEWGRVAVAVLIMVVAVWPVRQWTGSMALIGQVGVGALTYALALVFFDVAGSRRWIQRVVR